MLDWAIMKPLLLLLLAFCTLSAAEPRLLFNGKDLAGWKMVGPGRFVLEDGMLKTEGGMGLLYYTGEKFGYQTVRVVFKTASQNANSGVYIRMADQPLDPWYGVHNGYEVQIDAGGDDWHSTGALYSLSKISKRAQKPNGEWNTMDIQLDGQVTRVFLNGEKINEFSGDQQVPARKQWFEPVRGPRPDSGYIGLQNHDKNSTVYFKEVSVLPLDGSSALAQGDRDRMLSYLYSTKKQILDSAAGLSAEQLKYKPGPDRWSIADVLEHLTLAEEKLFANAMNTLTSKEPAPAKKLADEMFYGAVVDRSTKRDAPEGFRPTGMWGAGELAGEFAARRDRNIDWVRSTQADLRGHFVKLFGTSIDGYQALLMLPSHNERHLQQINEVKASPGFPKR